MRFDSSLVIRNPAELIAALPFILGYHPYDSIALLGLRGRDLAFSVCFDLPPADCDSDSLRAGAGEVADAIQWQSPGVVVIVGYGPPRRVTPVILALVEALRAAGVRMDDVIRVGDGRWWSYLCEDPSCCPPDGRPCLPLDSVIAAEATYRGRVALPNRAALIAQVAACQGPIRESMGAATERARRRFRELITGVEGKALAKRIRQTGRAAVREAEKRHRTGGFLDDDEVAWLGVLLADRAVEDFALDRTGETEWRIRLWTDVLRRVEPVHVPAPACLLGFTAWRMGRGALARVAVDRALAVEPAHDLAVMLHQILGFGVPPAMMRPRAKNDARHNAPGGKK
ncbi:DUF4192 domain-containing protein [Actinoplanes couchii]|uniref:DUF4192 domain-containing protein n=1 Tax=Actinoplanes couchii TaxID=403638 RepID=A0ABQ3XJ96_9ACTN|nr:DUF4192 domain-containing protein [Actinoplanes couchii]MDR6324424.1 hypothetical protein [Actinoplanes couchii]GID58574.1 hypothetical protein Aco03nite_069780 [Actinoplanes couchii]